MLVQLLFLLLSSAHAFVAVPPQSRAKSVLAPCRMSMQAPAATVSRRAALQTAAAAVAATTAVTAAPVTAAAAETYTIAPAPAGTRIVVLGGNGFVGSAVCAALLAAGAEVVSVSRSDAHNVPGVTTQVGDLSKDDLTSALRGAAAVVSCIGVIGTDDALLEAGNGAVNVAAAAQTAAAGVKRFVYVGVADAVPNALANVALKGYFRGKAAAQAAALDTFGSSATVIKPSFIFGGSSFGVAPPRVPSGYGGLVQAALSTGIARAAAGVAPGIVGVALMPPVAVEAVAYACAAAALGRVSGVIDGTDAINAAAKKAATA
jgi:nucleoside-diphosphate-sugar epimerase